MIKLAGGYYLLEHKRLGNFIFCDLLLPEGDPKNYAHRNTLFFYLYTGKILYGNSFIKKINWHLEYPFSRRSYRFFRDHKEDLSEYLGGIQPLMKFNKKHFPYNCHLKSLRRRNANSQNPYRK